MACQYLNKIIIIYQFFLKKKEKKPDDIEHESTSP